MKTLFYITLTVIAVSFASCGNKTTGAQSSCDSDTVLVNDTIVDTLTIDTL